MERSVLTFHTVGCCLCLRVLCLLWLLQRFAVLSLWVLFQMYWATDGGTNVYVDLVLVCKVWMCLKTKDALQLAALISLSA